MLMSLNGKYDDSSKTAYDISYHIDEDVCDIHLIQIAYEGDKSIITEIPLLHFDGKRTVGEGIKILEENTSGAVFFNGFHYRFGIAIQEIIRRENKWVHETLFCFSNDKKQEPKIGIECFGRFAKESVFPVINFTNIDGDSFEKILKSMGADFLYGNISKRIISVNNDGSKLNQVLGIPKKIIQLVKDNYPNQISAFQKICSILDGNDAIYLLEFLDEVYGKTEDNPGLVVSYQQMVGIIADIEGLRKTPMPALLTYIMRQLYYSYSFTSKSFKNVNGLIATGSVLRDTLSMYKTLTGKSMDSLPSDLYHEHQVLTENYNALNENNDATETSFIEAAKKYSWMNKEGSQFIIKAPESITELVVEGTTLRHCVASYKERISEGKSVVMFLRKAEEPQTPFVTVEYDEEYGIVQIKGFLDQDVLDPEVLKFAHEWEKGVMK